MLKRLIRSSAGSFLLSVILAVIMGSLVASLRWHHTGRTELKKRLKSGKPEIIVFWHEHLFVMSPILPTGCSALQSPHPDGRVLAGASRLFGLRPIWGSSNRNALSGLRQMAGQVKAGRTAVITPDGPRGPARQMSIGPVNRRTDYIGRLVSTKMLARKKLGQNALPKTVQPPYLQLVRPH